MNRPAGAAVGAAQALSRVKHRPKLPPSPAGEIDLLAQYRDGDLSAFRRLVDLYRERMLQFFYRLCWDRDRAEDLTQELFLKLMLASKRYRPEGRMATFLYRVATNLWIDHYRQQRPRPRFHSFDQVLHRDVDEPGQRQYAGNEPSPQQQLSDGEEREALRRALERLTEPHRLVFELAVYQERPYGEISELLGIPVGTVKSRMHNATTALKQLLGEARQHTDDDAAPRRAGGLP